MGRHNVTSGPAMFPESVLEKLSRGIIEYEQQEISILEIAHRSQLFEGIRNELISLTRELLQVPQGFSVIYLQGGGRLHLAQLPMNFLSDYEEALFIDTGYWSQIAEQYASKYGSTQIISSGKDDGYNHIPIAATNNLSGRYLQYCSNNTIHGTRFSSLLTASVPTIVDMSSEIFSCTIDFEKVDVVLACAQKNIGPAGISLLIIRNDFLATGKKNVPAVFNYKNLADANSNYSTPPIFQCCACLEMLRWMKSKGGISNLAFAADQRAQILYNAIDQSELVNNTINREFRSIMNIVFDTTNESVAKDLQEKFNKANIIGISGHKSRGGFRVGNYLAQRIETIQRIAEIIS